MTTPLQLRSADATKDAAKDVVARFLAAIVAGEVSTASVLIAPSFSVFDGPLPPAALDRLVPLFTGGRVTNAGRAVLCDTLSSLPQEAQRQLLGEDGVAEGVLVIETVELQVSGAKQIVDLGFVVGRSERGATLTIRRISDTSLLAEALKSS